MVREPDKVQFQDEATGLPSSSQGAANRRMAGYVELPKVIRPLRSTTMTVKPRSVSMVA